jgi:hypothetical protein
LSLLLQRMPQERERRPDGDSETVRVTSPIGVGRHARQQRPCWGTQERERGPDGDSETVHATSGTSLWGETRRTSVCGATSRTSVCGASRSTRL